MKMNIERIQNKLKGKITKLFINQKNSTSINHVKLFKNSQTYFKQDALYVMEASTLSPEIQNANILCIGEIKNAPAKAKESNLNLLVINDIVGLDDIVDEIQIILDKYRDLLQSTSILFEMLAEGTGLQKIINKGYELLGNMVLLSDTSFSVFLFSENAKVDDALKKWIYEDPSEVYNNFYVKHREKRGFEKSYKAKTPIYISKDIDEYSYLSSNIFLDDKKVAHLTVVESEKNIVDDDYDVISLLCKVISLEMQKDKLISNSRGFLYESLFLDLLEGRITDPIIIDERINSLDIKFDGNLYVLTAAVNQNDKANTMISHLRNMMESMIKEMNSVIYNESIVCLLNVSDTEKPLQKVDLLKLNYFLKSNKMRIGISYCFNNLRDLQKYYKQSIKTIELGMHTNNETVVYSYEEYMKYHLFDICSKNTDMLNFCHPAVLKLLEYDNINNTEFTHSLYAYLDLEKNQIDTANALHIHRSTLLYRLKKSEEIMNINLKNSGLIFDLLVSLKILKYMGNIK